jgi:hypothetical protein
MVDYGMQAAESDEDCEDLYIQLENVLASVRHVKANAASDVHSGARGTECIILDNGAEVSIFNNKRLFTNLRECEPICIDGVNKKSEGVHVATIGTTAFGEAYYSNAVMGNILSFGRVWITYIECHTTQQKTPSTSKSLSVEESMCSRGGDKASCIPAI